ncbi:MULTISPECIES: type II toxin-antitoxin system HigA family antitoxin [Mesorhizobium]|jgi:HTH-type transcriptional regulator / antitoxin HigA|uniref:HTH-type transcriptional regulator/antitoxin HigA n=1 Tax=Rhizobium loti TaxID=381 RepID=A0A8E2WKV9_RHILI|nr:MULTISPECIES: type II toxin-antitoxin system HigA family antitoxin [Mesorhizobium]AZO44261.1 type II toxin-antitoxin system HigA family antitoxin [Mesorhizobium sp. M7D.F.Ca.US.005.01.1.1]PWJ94884.1 HTH-type transcriptional regulator/antitoxin HigA [Mesorhizobium loti]RUX95088.1 type II toxin-antitoxin system HigA family antitoxin [Mesorhizobium sp. M7D.F.Ca.US.004.01.2.1]RVA33918.1 type II toxin-antitoxin system HigA family antitoxin [Mesorhizobium sp. M7D.F.Ca.US.004.03.1.1]
MENIRPIKTEADYDWAIAEITKYFENEPEVGSLEGDRFDVLATLIEAYEDKHYPIEAPDPVEAIHSHMELFNLSRKALAEVIGSSPRATEVLNRKRALTLDMVFKLNKEWNIPAEVLVQPYHLANDRGRKRA